MKGIIKVAAAANTNKKIIFKNCARLTDCISKRNNTQIHHAKENCAETPSYNLIEYSDSY